VFAEAAVYAEQFAISRQPFEGHSQAASQTLKKELDVITSKKEMNDKPLMMTIQEVAAELQ
jgi:hypothetical protein